ncbi:MobF family relaxase [Amycolatopsis acidicola]|nr:MobF family relaxase [Amycolatopsis acidicola]
MGLRKLSPGGHEYLTNTVACGDRDRRLEPGELLSDYYLSRGYPAGQWFGAGAEALGLSGAVTPAQMNALYGEGRHPNADAIEAEMIADGATALEALNATKLGRRFPRYSALDHMRSTVSQAYKDYNRERGRPVGAPISATVRAQLRRAVQVRAFTDAHKGKPPGDNAELQNWLASQKSSLKSAVSGFEMVFAPDKSVSIAWAFAKPDERELIAGLVRQAARDALGYLERNAAFTRRGNMGEAQVDINGITAALFEHWDSRASDPHLHIHALVSSKAQRSDDGQWTALDGRTIMAATVTASEYFDNRLRDLFRQHGASWVQRGAQGVDLTRPIWQLAGVDVGLVRLFSKRHRQFEAARAARIVAFRKENQKEPTPKDIFAIDRLAQYDSRPGKQPPKTLQEHVHAWRDAAAQLVAPEALAAMSRRLFAGRQPYDEVDIASLARDTRTTVSENYAHFSWWNLAAEAHRQSAGLSVPVDKREQLIDDIVSAVLSDPSTLALTGPAIVEARRSLRRRDGESVFVERRSTRYTTTETLAHEGDLVALARRRGGHRLRTSTVDTALEGRKLNAGQERMVREFAQSGRRLQLALAPAGAGKTSAMKVLATAWRRTGHRVYAFGPSARAAQELGLAIGARPHTLHQLTTTLRLGFADRAFPVEAGDLIIIDEAAMAGTHTLHAVVRYAINKGAEVRLIGDDAQLAAVEAGGAIRLIAHDVGAVRFREIVRFHGPDRAAQAAASLKIRVGDKTGLKYYVDNDRVSDGSLETMRDRAHACWRSDLDAGVQSLLIVPTNEDTVALNVEARRLRISRGQLERGRQVELHDATTASVGDWVVTRRNQRLLSLFGGRDFVKNGDVWTVKSVHGNGKLTVEHRRHKGTVTLPAGYVRAHVELAYAATVNRVQGMTSTGTAHLLVPPTMTREQLYPGVTRAMRQNFMYVITHHHVIDQHQETPEPSTPEAVLTGVLNHSGAEVSATETLRDALAESESLGTLVKQYNYTATYRDEERYLAILERNAPSTLDCDGEAALLQTLRNGHDLGWEAEHLITTALGRSGVDGMKDPAAALQSRIAKHLERHDPPPRKTSATPHDIARWRGIFDTIAPHAAVEDPGWDRVWRRAAGALAAGYNVDAALTVVAHQLDARVRGPDPMTDDRFADLALQAELDRRSELGEAHRPAVPWLARPDFTTVRYYPGHGQFLHDTNTAIDHRVDELRAAAVRETPGWITSLGARPDSPIIAAEWDDLVGLVAGYRETFNITSDDPTAPLGEEPESHGARAHAWRILTERWQQYGWTPATTEAGPPEPEDHDLDESFDEFEPIDERHVLEPLNVLVTRYDHLARDGDEDRFLDVLARYVPGAINAGAEPAALAALSRAQDDGWQAARLVRKLADDTGFSWANDPAAVLANQITNYTNHRRPPARIAEPPEADVVRWRTIVSQHLPDSSVGDDQWNIVWRHAAGGSTVGLDVDTALATAVRNVAHETGGADDGDQRRVGEALVAELNRQHRNGAGLQPVLPWQAVPDFARPGDYRGSLERLDALNAEIAARADQLAHETVRQQPRWLSVLGERPTDPADAARWDELVRLAAAYRETFGVTTNSDTAPLGTRPAANGLKAKAWNNLTDEWRNLMTTPDREAAESDAMATGESRRDTRDALVDEFQQGVDTEAKQLREDDDGAEREQEDLRRANNEASGFGY